MSNNKTTLKPARVAPGQNLSNDLVTEYCDGPLTIERLRADLDGMFKDAQDMLIEPARMGTLLKNVEAYRANLTSDEFSALVQGACILVKDLTQYRDRLDAIKSDQLALPWESNDLLEIQQPTFSLYERYHEWIASFTTVVLAEIATIQCLMQLAAKNSSTSNG